MPEFHPVCLGFDFGLKRIGMAVGHMETAQARPLKIITVGKEGIPWRDIDAAIQEWRPDVAVVGVPFHMDGRESDIGRLAKDFAGALRERYAFQVFEVDERLSTREARWMVQEALPDQRKPRRVDNVAAVVILQQWMTQKKRERND